MWCYDGMKCQLTNDFFILSGINGLKHFFNEWNYYLLLLNIRNGYQLAKKSNNNKKELSFQLLLNALCRIFAFARACHIDLMHNAYRSLPSKRLNDAHSHRHFACDKKWMEVSTKYVKYLWKCLISLVFSLSFFRSLFFFLCMWQTIQRNTQIERERERHTMKRQTYNTVSFSSPHKTYTHNARYNVSFQLIYYAIINIPFVYKIQISHH